MTFFLRLLLVFSFGACILCIDTLRKIEEIKSVCGEDLVLRCTAHLKRGVQYRGVRWYKEILDGPSPELSGLLAHSLPNGTTQWYLGLEREVELVKDSLDILLPAVNSADSGRYICFLSAPVGQQNQEGKIQLIVTGCPTEAQMEDVYLVIVAAVLLGAALLIFFISYICLRNMIQKKYTAMPKESIIDATIKPLEKKDLMLLYTLGSNWSKPATMKHICV